MTLAGDLPAWFVGLLAMAVLVMLNISGLQSAKAMDCAINRVQRPGPRAGPPVTN